MHLTVKGKQLDVGEALRTHVADSLGVVFDKYFGKAIDATVIMSREAHLYHAHVSVRVGRGIMMQSHADADAPYVAYDLAAEHLAKRLRRYKRRLRDHHRTETEPEQASQYILAGAPEENGEKDGADMQPVVIAEMEMPIPTLSVGEAVMRLDLADTGAMMFRNSAHGGLNMVYRRADGNVGWVDPRGNRGA